MYRCAIGLASLILLGACATAGVKPVEQKAGLSDSEKALIAAQCNYEASRKVARGDLPPSIREADLAAACVAENQANGKLKVAVRP